MGPPLTGSQKFISEWTRVKRL